MRRIATPNGTGDSRSSIATPSRLLKPVQFKAPKSLFVLPWLTSRSPATLGLLVPSMARELRPAQQSDRNPFLPTRLIGHLTGTWCVPLEVIMDSVLFTDHGILVFVITGSAIALVLSVLGLATTQQAHSDIKNQLAAVRGLVAHNERNLLKDQFQALVREGSDSIGDIFDAQFRRRFSELINRTTERGNRTHFDALRKPS